MNFRHEDNGTISLNWNPDEPVEFYLADGTVKRVNLRPLAFVDNVMQASVTSADVEEGVMSQSVEIEEQPFHMEKITKELDLLVVLAEF